MKFNVNKNLCIGCGACVSICPEIFTIDDDGFAGVKTDNNIDESIEGCAMEALESCPTDAIEKD
ncbi:MAG: ferredoxin [Bacilli bacterium]|jgi:ferredoxin|nr:ferredoxin [Bacilli bacterium]